MALSQSALSELLEAIRAGDGSDTLREAMRLVLQELIELEASQTIGAARYERTDERTTGPRDAGHGGAPAAGASPDPGARPRPSSGRSACVPGTLRAWPRWTLNAR
jgi:hypothetical protein